MLKIKIKDKINYLESSIKGGCSTLLEGIVLLDMAIDNLRNEFELDDEQIAKYLNKYKKNLKEVK